MAPLSISHKRSGFRANPETDEHVSISPSRLLSRRGLHINGFALMAPPDASPKTYTDLTPPPTAPITGDRTAETPSHPCHQRSASDITHTSGHTRLHHKSSRDVGILSGGMFSIPERVGSPRDKTHDKDALKAPIFQTPTKSRSPSPAVHTPDLSDSTTSSLNDSSHATPPTETIRVPGPLLTPSIGEEQDIAQPVVGPVVVGLRSDEVLRRQSEPTPQPSANMALSLNLPTHSTPPYLFYQAGLHATAGPLPPPPRSIFDADNQRGPPPPRPPRLRTPAPRRDLDASKEPVQLPSPVSIAPVSRACSAETSSQYSLTPPEVSVKASENKRVQGYVLCLFVVIFSFILTSVSQGF